MRLACILATALFPIAFRLALSGVLPHPEPAAHDEFAYLLGADLFAHGRLAAPPHPLAPFFEQVHILSDPVRAPKYPPAQAVFLAAGQIAFGDPFYGVLLSVAAFAAAVYWMLRAYVRPAWALLGGASTALYFGAGNYWTESYWGGAVAALGAALLIGSFGRLPRRAGCGALFGAGALLLVNSRPFESAPLLLALCFVLARRIFRRRNWRAAVVTLTSLTVAGALTLAYNVEVTGHALKMPYMLWMEQSASTHVLWFQSSPSPKHFANAALEASAEKFDLPEYQAAHELSLQAHAADVALTIAGILIFDGGGFAMAPLVLLPLLWRDQQVRLFAGCAVLLSAILVSEIWLFFHYMAPLVVVGILLVCLALDRLWRFRRAPARDRVVLVSVLTMLALTGPLWRASNALAGRGSPLYSGSGFGQRRAAVARRILEHPGLHVVFVHYTPDQSSNEAWVANGADIDGARLVWAHDRGAEDALLGEYFQGRTFWCLEDRGSAVHLAPCPSRTAWTVQLGPAQSDIRLERYQPAPVRSTP